MTEQENQRSSGWLTGPVVITGADGHVGRSVQLRLADQPNPVRPLGRTDNWADAIRDADTVIHLAGTLQPKRPDTYETANVTTIERCLDALADSSAQRLVLLSYVGANPSSENDYLRTKGKAEQLVRDSGVPSVIFRSTFIYGNPGEIGPSFSNYQANPGETVSVLGDGMQQVAPIHVADLTSLLVSAALDPSTPTGMFEVSGPHSCTLDQFVASINPAEVRIKHLPPPIARILARVMRDLTPALVEVLLSDSVAGGDPAETAEAFGVSLENSSGSMERSTE